jgi:hypothetical protein
MSSLLRYFASKSDLVWQAACVQAATMSALIWWGAHDEGAPSEAVDLALRDLENGFAQC